jgi:hypothetical protein
MGYWKRVIEAHQAAIRRARAKAHELRFKWADLNFRETPLDTATGCGWGCIAVSDVRCAMGVLDDVFASTKKAAPGRTVDDPDFQQRYPILYELLTNTEPVNGTARVPATLTLLTEDGMAKGGVHDRQRAVSLWQSSTTILGVLVALEEALTARPVPWRRTDASQYSRGRPRT